MNLQSVMLEDEYVKLMPMTIAHIDDLYQAGQDLSIWKWTTFNYCESLAATKEWIESCLTKATHGTQLPFVVFDKITQSIVGSTSYLNIDLDHALIEIGYTFLSLQAQRSHVNRRCKLLLLTHAFEALKLNRVQLQTHEKNDKSRNAILGIGAKFEGITRHCRIQHDGSVRSSAIYSIIKPEWQQVQANLKGKIDVYTA